MDKAMDDMRRDGIVFSCLSGNRQRYEYFGFIPTGNAYSFMVNEGNIKHTLGRDWKTGLSLKHVEPGDETLLDQIQSLHEAKAVRFNRRREKLLDILSSWKAKVFAITEGNNFIGYFLYKTGKTGECEITEINLHDLSRLPEALGLFLRQNRSINMKDYVLVTAGSHEKEKIIALARFAEKYTQAPAYHIAVFDYTRFIGFFLKLISSERNLAEGSFIIKIEDGAALRLSVQQGVASVAETETPADLCLSTSEALCFLFSPLAAKTIPAIEKNIFLQSLLPLPLSFEDADKN